MKKLLLVFSLRAVAVVAQMTPTPHTVTLGWTAPAGCTTTDPCTFVISRATIAAGGTCPVTTGSTYTPLNVANPSTGTSFVDPTAGGTTDCYIAQTLQGGAVSVPSNTAGPVVVPQNPAAPTLENPTVAGITGTDPRPPKTSLASIDLKIHIAGL